MKILTISDEKWKLLEDFFPQHKRGRPQKWSNRAILEAVLYLLHTGCQWRSLPKSHPPYQTAYRRFRQWEKQGFLSGLRDTLLEALQEGGVNFSVSYIDATFVRAMGGGDLVGHTKIGKGSKIMALVDKQSRPIAAIVASAQPHEIKLLKETLDDLPPTISPKIIIGDKAYDSDPHDKELARKGIELIAPHRKNRKKSKTQDGRRLKRYKGRWVVERFFSWMKPARRLLTRFDKKACIFQGFLDLFCALTLIKHL